MKSFLALALVAASTPPGTARAATDAPAYHITRTVPLGAPDKWDYLTFDPASGRVFIAHGDRVTVVDGKDGHVIGEVTGLSSGTHGIAISTVTGRGFTDDGHGGYAGSFDLKTLKAEDKITADADADAMTFDPRSGHIFVIDGDPGKVTVIDPATDKVVTTIDVGGGLEFAVADGRGKVYVNGAERKEIVRIDTAANTVDARWPVPDCTSPHGLAIDAATRRLFSSCVNEILVVVDADSGREVAKLPIGKGTDAAAFDPKRKLIFSSNGVDGTLSVIAERDADHFEPVATIKTAVTGRTMTLDPESGRIFIAAADIDPAASHPGERPKPLPGSLKLLVLDPVP